MAHYQSTIQARILEIAPDSSIFILHLLEFYYQVSPIFTNSLSALVQAMANDGPNGYFKTS